MAGTKRAVRDDQSRTAPFCFVAECHDVGSDIRGRTYFSIHSSVV
jgi:hypothetical protein